MVLGRPELWSGLMLVEAIHVIVTTQSHNVLVLQIQKHLIISLGVTYQFPYTPVGTGITPCRLQSREVSGEWHPTPTGRPPRAALDEFRELGEGRKVLTPVEFEKGMRRATGSAEPSGSRVNGI